MSTGLVLFQRFTENSEPIRFVLAEFDTDTDTQEDILISGEMGDLLDHAPRIEALGDYDSDLIVDLTSPMKGR